MTAKIKIVQNALTTKSQQHKVVRYFTVSYRKVFNVNQHVIEKKEHCDSCKIHK